MKKKMDIEEAMVAIVIVNYNSASVLCQGIPRIIQEITDYTSGIAIIVDNASPGDDAQILEAFLDQVDHQGRVHLLKSSRNGGFAAGNNLAFEWLRGSGFQGAGIMLLNPDATLRPGTLGRLISILHQYPNAGLVGAALMHANGTPATAAFHFPTLGVEVARELAIGPIIRLWPIAVDVGNTPLKVDWVSGAAFLIRRELIDEVGELDEGYFLYFEEIDYARRVQDAGWEVWHTPHAVVDHDAGSSTGIVDGKPKMGRMPHYWFDSWLRYFTKNHGVFYARLTALMRLIGMIIGSVVCVIRGRPQRNDIYFFIDFLRYCLIPKLDTGYLQVKNNDG